MNDSTEPADAFDPELEALFRRTHTGIADGTFSAATMRRVEARRSRLRLRRHLLEAAAIVAIVVASPWLIDASVRLSTLLDTGLALASEWLATPAGMIIGIASVVGAVALRPFVAFWATLLWRRATRWR